MGFSAFGAPPNPPKRRKLHQDIEREGTGGNSIPLGRRRGEEVAGDGGEEVVGDGSEEEEGDGGVENENGNEGHEGQETEEDKQGDEMILEEVKKATLRRLGITPHSATLPAKPPASTIYHTRPIQTPPQPLGYGAVTEVVTQGGDAVAQGGAVRKEAYDWRALRKGVRDENGDVAYYDGSFVEDPWRGLMG